MIHCEPDTTPLEIHSSLPNSRLRASDLIQICALTPVESSDTEDADFHELELPLSAGAHAQISNLYRSDVRANQIITQSSEEILQN